MTAPESELVERIDAELADVRSLLHQGGGAIAGVPADPSARFVTPAGHTIDVLEESPGFHWVVVVLQSDPAVFSTESDVASSLDELRDLIVAIARGSYEVRRRLIGTRLVVEAGQKRWTMTGRRDRTRRGH